MASTSTSTIQKSFKYDVFLSFRGEDTRKNFVDHLYNALKQKGIETYKDDEKIRKGKTISDELIQAIEDSKFYIIVFSKNYATSSWCLDELVKIMECQKMSEHTAYPVFLDVEPSEVRKQNGVVEVAFAKHANDKSDGKWREALKKAADLAGWELKNIFDGHEAKLVQKIVEEISLELRFINSGVDENFIGMKARINDVASSLELGVDDVRMIGIKGMGGAGKTTLARAVYDYISYQFEGCSFVENVREKSAPSMSSLNLLQKQVLSDVLSDQGISVSGVLEGKSMLKKNMCGRKVLIVLDDVDKIEQLVALAGDRNWFNPGSRIIITTRDAQVLIAHKVNLIHDVHLLTDKEAMCLFSRHAFGRAIPIEGYKELSEQVVRYAAGLPLTIIVLGSFLCGKDDLDWKDALERLETIPLNETMNVLELSYIALEEDYKEIFLDVACILKGWWKEEAIRALESCGFRARIGLRVLEQKSLITLSKYGELEMHDHIEEMGKNIVRRLNPNEPERHSRLWIDEEIEEILANGSGTQATKCITLDARGWNYEILMNGLANMKKLRFLHVYPKIVSFDEVSNWNFDEDSLHLPNALRFLSWSDYPFSSLPKKFQAKNLVGLEMYSSNIVQLWKDGEEMACLKLRFLKFTFSELRTLDLSVAPNLETLILEYCSNLVEVHFQVTPNLKELRINFCNRLEKLHLPPDSPKLRSLDLNDSKLRNLHLGMTPNLETLRLSFCIYMVECHMPVECPKLVTLHLTRNEKLRTLDLGLTPNLESLDLHDCYDLEEINAPAECLKKLLHLRFSNCGRFKSFEFDKELDSSEVVSLSELHLIADDTGICDPNNTWPEFKFSCYYKEDPASSFGNLGRLISLGFGARINVNSFSDIICGLQCLRKLTLEGGIPEVPKNLDRLDCLEELSLRSTVIKNLPDSICMLKHLKFLEIKSCCVLEKLPEDIGRLECLERLFLMECALLRDIPSSICDLERLYLDISHCGRFKSFKFDKKLDSPKVVSLSELHLIADDTGICDPNNTWPEFQFWCDYKEDPASSFGNLARLISLGFGARINVDSFSDIIYGLQCLRKLTLEGGIPEAPKNLDRLDCLEELSLRYTNIKTLPDGICLLKHLKSLELDSCFLLEKLPVDIGRLECLESLILFECTLLQDFPNSIYEMKSLKCLELTHCIQVEKLPEEIGRLECLKELNILGSGISHLPRSLYGLRGLRIIGDRWLLESCGFTPKRRRMSDETDSYFDDEMVCDI